MDGESEGSEEGVGPYSINRGISWDSSNADVLADLKAVAELIINMCNYCAGRGQIMRALNQYPWIEWEVCPGCKGTRVKPKEKNETTN